MRASIPTHASSKKTHSTKSVMASLGALALVAGGVAGGASAAFADDSVCTTVTNAKGLVQTVCAPVDPADSVKVPGTSDSTVGTEGGGGFSEPVPDTTSETTEPKATEPSTTLTPQGPSDPTVCQTVTNAKGLKQNVCTPKSEVAPNTPNVSNVTKTPLSTNLTPQGPADPTYCQTVTNAKGLTQTVCTPESAAGPISKSAVPDTAPSVTKDQYFDNTAKTPESNKTTDTKAASTKSASATASNGLAKTGFNAPLAGGVAGGVLLVGAGALALRRRFM